MFLSSFSLVSTSVLAILIVFIIYIFENRFINNKLSKSTQNKNLFLFIPAEANGISFFNGALENYLIKLILNKTIFIQFPVIQFQALFNICIVDRKDTILMVISETAVDAVVTSIFNVN